MEGFVLPQSTRHVRVESYTYWQVFNSKSSSQRVKDNKPENHSVLCLINSICVFDFSERLTYLKKINGSTFNIKLLTIWFLFTIMFRWYYPDYVPLFSENLPFVCP